ncbi:MAG: sugar phosphate nucleotidyltransferase [Haloferacaceae archaeon]
MNLRTAVVLAGGEGERLRPLTTNRPKPMLPAGNRPILEYVFDSLIESGIERIHVVVGYRGTRVQDHFGPTYRDVPLQYHRQEKQLGSGHALLQVRDAIREPFLAVNGDQIAEPTIVADVLAEHERGDAVATLSVVESEEASRYGSVRLDGDEVIELVERPGGDDYRLLNAGVYGFDAAFLDELDATPRENGSLTLPGAVSRLVGDDAHLVRGVKTEGFWTDATYPWDLLTAARQVFAMEWIGLPERSEGVWIADSATVHPDATLQPPVAVSADCEVGAGAVVGPTVALGTNATVEANAVVRDSVIGDDSRIGANATAIDAVFGQDVGFGPGSVIPGGKGDVRVNDRIHEGARLGAVLADRVDAEAGVSFAPGVLVGPSASIDGGVRIALNVTEGAEVTR